MEDTDEVRQHKSQQIPYLFELKRSLNRNNKIGPTSQYLVLAGSLAKKKQGAPI